MEYFYRPKGTCSSLITIELDGDILKNVVFEGGCDGNLQGVSALVKGMNVRDVIQKLEGIRCGMKTTSCPDQLCRALHELDF